MEKERFLGNWQPSDQLPLEMACPPAPCFFNLNWDHSMDANPAGQFDSALSSLVSSPTSAANPAGPTADGVVIRELIGRLGSICSSGEISPPPHYMNGEASAGTSCYSTPLSSPPKLNLSVVDHTQTRGGIPLPGGAMPAAHLAPFSADPGFAERAARFSCFGGRSYGGLPGQFGLPEAGKLSRVPSSQSLKANASQIGVSENGIEVAMPEGAQFGSRASAEGEFRNSAAHEESSASEPNAGPADSNSRKRKAPPKGKAKETPVSASLKDPPKAEGEDSNVKRSRSADGNAMEKDAGVKTKVEQNGGASSNGDCVQKQGKENNAKPPEPPKQDYIHVRARRGQATDSHSLAERVRREKISERMKFLQDLVPGCNKVTGKAVMLDEIINYVQSLQRQVEFLSMKLATVNPRLDFNMENFLPKDVHQPRGLLPHPVYPMESAAAAFSYAHQPQQGTPLQSIVTNGLEPQCSVNPLDPNLRRTAGMQLPPLDGFGDAASQLGSFWEDDLQTVVQMGFVQNQEAVFSSQSFHGSLPTAHMKIEL